MSDDLEDRKLEMENRKLEFEIRKYDADAELRKVSLDKAKEDLTKTKEDVKASQRPFWGNPTYLGPLATICVAILGGFFAFGTNLLNLDVVSLRHQQTQLETTNSGLIKDKENLTKQATQLGQQIDGLTESKNALISSNGILTEQKGKLTKQVAVADAKIVSLNKESATLADNIVVDRINYDLRDILSASYIPVNQGDRGFLDLVSMMSQPALNAKASSKVMEIHNNPRTSVMARPMLSLIMYKSTSNPLWRTRLMDDTLAGINSGLATKSGGQLFSFTRDYLRWIRDLGIFDAKERASFLKKIYATDWATIIANSAETEVSKRLDTRMMLLISANWDVEASTLYRDPWIDNYSFSGEEVSGTMFYSISPEAYAIAAMIDLSNGGELRAVLLPGELGQKCDFPKDVPLCTDIAIAETAPNKTLALSDEKRQEYSRWLRENDSLRQVFIPADGDFKRLRSLPNDVFKDIVIKRWVTRDRIPQ